MLGGWVKERASSLARLDRFDVSRLCVDKVDYTAGGTPYGTDSGKLAYIRGVYPVRVYFRIQILI